VAVLFRRTRYAAGFKEILLEAGWPARLGLGDNPFAYAEVRGLLAAFHFLNGLDPELNLAAALRSPLGPVSDSALLGLVWPPAGPLTRLTEYFGPGARPWPAGLPPDDLEALAELRGLLDELTPLVGRLKPVDSLERLVEDRRLLPLAALEPDGEDRARAVTTFLALSRTVGLDRDRQPLNPAEELAEMGRNRRGRSDPDLRPEEEAVTLLTVHAAKGLEFPVVIIAEADVSPRPPAPWAVVAGDGRLALTFRDAAGRRAPTASALALADEEEKLEKEENRRLLYVAATRARDHLVFMGRPKNAASAEAGPPAAKKKNNSPDPGDPLTGSWLEALLNCPEALALSREFIFDPAASGDLPPGPTASIEPRVGKGEINLKLLAPMVPAGRSLSATALAHLPAEPQWPRPEDFWPLSAETDSAEVFSEAPAKILTPAEAGTLFHAVLEIIDPLEPYPRELLAAEADRLDLAPAAEELAGLAARIETFLAGPLGRAWGEARAAGRAVFREWPFQMRLTEPAPTADPPRYLNVTGQIDLFFQTPAAGWIVDYKLAAPPPAPRLAVYERQVRLYARALAGAGWAGPIRAWLYFAGAAEPAVCEVDLKTGWEPDFWEKVFKSFFPGSRTSRLRL
jgi:ATP-dependent exoDNAse (exonuclease V) beta subunit